MSLSPNGCEPICLVNQCTQAQHQKKQRMRQVTGKARACALLLFSLLCLPLSSSDRFSLSYHFFPCFLSFLSLQTWVRDAPVAGSRVGDWTDWVSLFQLKQSYLSAADSRETFPESAHERSELRVRRCVIPATRDNSGDVDNVHGLLRFTMFLHTLLWCALHDVTEFNDDFRHFCSTVRCCTRPCVVACPTSPM